MKHPARIVAAITFITASIGIALWATGYAPQSDHTADWKVTAFAVITFPLFFALAGLVFAVPCLYFKRNQPGVWESKQGRLALVGVLANPVLMLVMQIFYPLQKMDLIGDLAGDLVLVVIQTILLLLLGNYMSIQQPGSPMGMRNRWTLASDVVWIKTHRFFGNVLIGSLLVVAPFAAWIDPDNAVVALAITVVVVFILAQLYARRLSSEAHASNRIQ